MKLKHAFFISLVIPIIFLQVAHVLGKTPIPSNQSKVEHVQLYNKFINNFNAKKFKAIFNHFNQKMKNSISLDRTVSFLQKVYGKSGKIEKINRYYKVGPPTFKYYLKAETKTIILTISYDKKNLIQGLWVKLASNKLEQYRTIAEKIVTAYNNKKYKEIISNYNKAMLEALPLEKTAAFFSGIYNNNGKIMSVGPERISNSVTFAYPISFNNKKMILTLSFDESGKVQGMWVRDDIKPVKYPQVIPGTTVKQIAKAYLDSPAGIGLSIATYDKGKIKLYSFGEKKKNSGKKVDKFTLFEIGSITKTFTGAILQQMINEGGIRLNDSVQKYLPRGYSMPKFPGTKKEITFKDIVTHTSSLPRMPEDFTKHLKNNENPYKYYSYKHMLKYLKSVKLKREIGSKYEYSNLALGLLGNILSDIDKKSYEQMLKVRIFNPLKMKNSIVSLERAKNLALGHNIQGSVVPSWEFSGFEGAGAIKSSIEDMALYLKENIETKKTVNVISSNLFIPLYKSEDNSTISTTWHIDEMNGSSIINHNGATGGYVSVMKFDRKRKKGVVVLSNSTLSVSPVANKVFKIILQSK